MPVFLLTFVEGLLGPKLASYAKPLIYAVGGLLVLLAIFAAFKIHDHRVIAAHEAQVQQRAAKANDQAASERANDTITNSRTAEETHNAIAAQPDQPIAPTSRALGCQRLHHAGRRTPACP